MFLFLSEAIFRMEKRMQSFIDSELIFSFDSQVQNFPPDKLIRYLNSTENIRSSEICDVKCRKTLALFQDLTGKFPDNSFKT